MEFFGDKTTHKTSIIHLFDFKDCHGIILCNLQRLKSTLYEKSIREAEIMMGVSPELSIVNQLTKQ